MVLSARVARSYDPNDVVHNDTTKLGVEGERRMWLKVIISAAEDILEARTTGVAKRELNWFLSHEQYPRSFVWICQNLGLDPDYWRKRAWHLYYRRLRNGRIMLYGSGV